MSENIDISRKTNGDFESPREIHAGETNSAQTTAGPDSKKIETILAGAASLTLIAFLGALWKILA
jgi:hypothetical protein